VTTKLAHVYEQSEFTYGVNPRVPCFFVLCSGRCCYARNKQHGAGGIEYFSFLMNTLTLTLRQAFNFEFVLVSVPVGVATRETNCTDPLPGIGDPLFLSCFLVPHIRSHRCGVVLVVCFVGVGGLFLFDTHTTPAGRL